MPASIKKISALEILDSRGDPTLEVSVELSDGTSASAGVPSGASTGTFEAFELRDQDNRYGGKGVRRALENVNTILNDELHGFECTDQKGIDITMIKRDGTENKHALGANAILGVSLAVARAASASVHVPLYRYIRELAHMSEMEFTLPVPLINVINGGKHASTNLNIQEFWIIPHAEKFSERLRMGSEVFHTLAGVLTLEGMDTDVGNEGGYAPDMKSHRQAFDFLLQAISTAGYKAGSNIGLGMDAGASVLFDQKTRTYDLSLDKMKYSSEEFIQFYLDLLHAYPIQALEDPLAEEDWIAWQEFTAKVKLLNPDITVIGDDLFVTNVKRFQKGIDLSVANSILIKPNQIGTLSETLDCILLAKKVGYSTVISHRSGETTDTFIADLAVGVNSLFIKTGSMARGERLAKYNRLLAIEEELYG